MWGLERLVEGEESRGELESWGTTASECRGWWVGEGWDWWVEVDGISQGVLTS